MNFSDFKKKYQKIPIEEYSNQVPDNVMVSVCVQTYNHGKYIQECLESILKQKTDFDFEVLIGEDASSDNTRDICLDYAKKYPTKIRLFLHHRENNISINGSPSGRFNMLYNFYSSKGKYIAMCEGDDYWTDPLKLQRQVKFLENNTKYALTAENSKVLNEINNTENIFSKERNSKDYEIIDLLKSRKFHTASILFRINKLHLPKNVTEFPIGDTLLFITLTKHGKTHFSPYISSVYRLNTNGATRIENRLKWAQTVEKFYLLLDEYLNFQHSYILNENIYKHYQQALTWAKENRRGKEKFIAYIKKSYYYFRLWKIHLQQKLKS